MSARKQEQMLLAMGIISIWHPIISTSFFLRQVPSFSNRMANLSLLLALITAYHCYVASGLALVLFNGSSEMTIVNG